MTTIDPNGPWIVTTEGDCEDRSPRKNLGYFSGPIDRIAFGLADQAEYALHFYPLKIIKGETMPVMRSVVHVTVDGRTSQIDDLLKERPVNYTKGTFANSFKLVAGEAYLPLLVETLADKAKTKLTDQELEALKIMWKKER